MTSSQKVADSKPNFLNIRNYDIYLRRVGKRLIFNNSKTMTLSLDKTEKNLLNTLLFI